MNDTTSAPGARPSDLRAQPPARSASPRLARAFRPGRSLVAALVIGLLQAACGHADPASQSTPGTSRPIVVMISFDGFRWDYADRGVSPNLKALERRGVRADGLIPSFPTKTFPNHYTLVTGLTPGHHGIVANNIHDPLLERRFSLSDRGEVQSAEWWGGVPVWVTAERSGVPTAPLFWPGSEAPIDGVSPSHWLPWDASMTHVERVNWVLEKLDLPGDAQPRFLTLYFDETDIIGHQAGPDSEEILDAILGLDAALGLLMDGLEQRGLTDRVNVIVVSDHGMSPTSRDRVIFVDDYVDLDVANPVDSNPVLALWPAPEDVIPVYQALRDAHPRLSVFLRDSIPERFAYGASPRVPPILGIADEGWAISSRPFFESTPGAPGRGNHGYDPEVTDMWGVFIAAGPAFRRGLRVPAFRNVDVYPLLMEVLGLPTSPHDGDLAEVEKLLVRSPPSSPP